MEKAVKPRLLAFIREEECIGCTKCIQACPVDAIVGSNKLMHTVIEAECIGCKLCLPPCPVDCIDLLPMPAEQYKSNKEVAAMAKIRYKARQIRLSKDETPELVQSDINKRKNYIQAARERSQARKLDLLKR